MLKLSFRRMLTVDFWCCCSSHWGNYFKSTCIWAMFLFPGSLWRCLYFLCQCDLSPWAVSRDQVDRFSKENGFTGWTETSVKENKNINEAMRWVAYAVLGIGIQIYPSFTAASWTFLFLSKQEQTVPMECQLLTARDTLFSPEIIGDNEAFKPCGFTECHLVTKQTISAVFPFSFSGLFFIWFLESSLKRWWAIPEKICLCPLRGTTSTCKPSPPPAGPAASSIWLVFPLSSRRSFSSLWLPTQQFY